MFVFGLESFIYNTVFKIISYLIRRFMLEVKMYSSFFSPKPFVQTHS
jgi:hypothetical protein